MRVADACFDLTADQRLLQDSVLRYVKQRSTSELRKSNAASSSGHDLQMWQDFAEFGWLALPLPEAYGGMGGTAADVAVMMEAFGRGLIVEPYVSTVLLCGGLVASLGNEAQKSQWLTGIAEGTFVLALAHSEPHSRQRVTDVRTTAREVPGGWKLDGSKSLVVDAPAANALLVTARMDNGELGVFIVARPAAGLTEKALTTVDARRASHLVLDSVVVESRARLGEGDAQEALDLALDRARAAMCADALGCMRSLLETTIEYTRTRVQFDQPLANYQTLRHRMVEMAVHCEEAQTMVMLASGAEIAEPGKRALTISAVMNKLARCGRYVAEQAVQLHGAMGVTEEVLVGNWLKRLIAFETAHGTFAYHLDRYARLAGFQGSVAKGESKA